MQLKKHLYSFTYENRETELSKLECKYIFKEVEHDKLLFSNLLVDPSSSAFVKSRVDIISYSQDYTTLIENIKNESIRKDGFKVEYMVFDGDITAYPQRLEKLKDIGLSIDGDPDYYKPTITYALCLYDGTWIFGVLVKDVFDWYKHKKKPNSYSNSIGINIAKALVNIATMADRDIKLLDACCGVGTIMLEACFAGYNIEGCDINWKICKGARNNINHFNYTAIVHRSDIKDLSRTYDAAIIDLPYNLLSIATDADISHIIVSTGEISKRLVIVSTSDISKLINKAGFEITDYCTVPKRGKTSFARKIWVCNAG